MEILFAYLDKTRDFADWASKKNSSTHPPKYPYTIGVNGVGVNSKPFVLNDYFKEHLDKTDNIVAISVIDMVKKMRNYASHGYHEDETARLRGTIRTAREKMDEFLEKWCEFLKFLASFLV